MYHKLIILALLFLFPEESSTPKFPISLMLISDALPVQFWLTGCATYNEHLADGVHHKCFCAPWECDDEIKLQLTNNENDVGGYSLQIVDEDDLELDRLAFTKTFPLLLDPLTEGDNYDTGDEDWTLGAMPSIVTTDTSNIFRLSLISALAGTDYEFHYKIRKDGAFVTNGTITIGLYDESMNLLDSFDIVYIDADDVFYEDNVIFNGGGVVPAFIGIVEAAGIGTSTIEIHEFDLVTQADPRYIYNLSFTPSEIDICDAKVRFKIIRNVLPQLSEWQNNGVGDFAWTLGDNPFVDLDAGPNSSESLFVFNDFVIGREYTIHANLTKSDSSSMLFALAVTNDAGVNQFSQSAGVIGAGKHTVSLTFTATINTTRIAVRVVSNTGVVTTTMKSVSEDSEEIVAFSDCLEINQQHDDTVLLTYSNYRNFAGLVYVQGSPDTEFKIRIPAIFFHQRFPEEDEVIERSDSLVTLNGTVRKQRLLDTDYLPYYFHEKLKLILKHQILTIFSRLWVKQEAYEIVEGDRRWPVKKAKCWLSEKNFVHRNIL